MRQRIYRSFLGLAAVCVIALTALLSLHFYNGFRDRAFNDARVNAQMLAGVIDSLDGGQYSAEGLQYDFLPFIGDDRLATRVTIIAPDGEVLYDNQVLASGLENHSDRSEFIEAQSQGAGEELRYSDTQLSETYYYAVRLADGSVLRVSRTVNSIAGVFVALLPMVALVQVVVMLLAYLLARWLTSSIVEPLSSIDFESDNLAAYDELVPYAQRIDQQRQQITAQLAELQSRADIISTITANMREGLILLSESGKVLTANQSALAILKVSASDASAKDILFLCRDIDFQHGVGQCLAGSPAELVWQAGERVFNVYFSPVFTGDEVIGGIILFFDITEREGIERQRREFTANVSHELKTPLTAITALSEMITSGMAAEADIPGFAKRISTQASRLLDLINDIIKLSEFDEDSPEALLTAFDLDQLAHDVIDALQPLADDQNVAIGLTSERIQLTANRQMIDELLHILIDNAIKYNYPGGQVQVVLSSAAGMACIQVRDTGIGIPPEHQDRVFERFYRIDASRSKLTGGTGLGLSIAKHIAEYHGGHIELEGSGDEGIGGSGTTVSCYIPNKVD